MLKKSETLERIINTGIVAVVRAESIAEAVHYHRENYDGSGYPSGLKKSEIPLLARIIMVADYTDRHLRRGESSQIVIRKLRTLSGDKFDPADARIMENILNESNQ